MGAVWNGIAGSGRDADSSDLRDMGSERTGLRAPHMQKSMDARSLPKTGS